MMIVIIPPPIRPIVGSGAPDTGNSFGCVGVGLLGVLTFVVPIGVAVTLGPQLHESSAVHPGRRHIPEAHVRSDGQSAFEVHCELQLGPQVQVSTAVHPARRHRPD